MPDADPSESPESLRGPAHAYNTRRVARCLEKTRRGLALFWRPSLGPSPTSAGARMFPRKRRSAEGYHFADRGETHVPGGNRAGVSRAPGDADKDVLRLPGDLRRAAEHSHLCRVPRAPG